MLDAELEEEVLENLAGLRTIQPPPSGWLRITSDGRQMWLEQGN